LATESTGKVGCGGFKGRRGVALGGGEPGGGGGAYEGEEHFSPLHRKKGMAKSILPLKTEDGEREIKYDQGSRRNCLLLKQDSEGGATAKKPSIKGRLGCQGLKLAKKLL